MPGTLDSRLLAETVVLLLSEVERQPLEQLLLAPHALQIPRGCGICHVRRFTDSGLYVLTFAYVEIVV